MLARVRGRAVEDVEVGDHDVTRVAGELDHFDLDAIDDLRNVDQLAAGSAKVPPRPSPRGEASTGTELTGAGCGSPSWVARYRDLPLGATDLATFDPRHFTVVAANLSPLGLLS